MFNFKKDLVEVESRRYEYWAAGGAVSPSIVTSISKSQFCVFQFITVHYADTVNLLIPPLTLTSLIYFHPNRGMRLRIENTQDTDIKRCHFLLILCHQTAKKQYEIRGSAFIERLRESLVSQ